MGQITNVEIIQRSVVLELLRDDHHPVWRFDELHTEIYDAPSDVLREAIGLLEAGGVLQRVGVGGVRATLPVVCLDGLAMVCI